ncbi:MAG: glycosyltransferase family 87 protein [Leptospira sp.]|nr:glycosyltransferase family 87 protein [Leptospira sp.]
MWKSFQKSEIGGRFVLILFLCYFLVASLSRVSQKSDFLDYYHASERWKTSENLYKFDVAYELKDKVKSWEELFLPENISLLTALQTQTATYIYPPLFSFLLLPLTYFSEKTASGIHTSINFLSLCGILFLFSRPEKFGIRIKNIEWLLSLVLVINFRYIESHIQNNQVGLLLVLLVLLSLTVKNEIISGILLALATTIKVTPIVFLFVLFYEKKWRSILWFFIGLFLWNLLPMVYNPHYTIEMTKVWFQEVLGNALTNPLLRSWKNNQSLPSTLAKYFISGADFVNQPLYRMPFVSLSMEVVKFIQLVIIGIFGIPVLFILKMKDKKWELTALLFLASAIFSGISWIHSFVICIFPIFLLISRYLNQNYTKKESISLILILVIPLLTHRSIIGGVMEGVFLMFSILFYTSIALYIFILREIFIKDEIRN